MARKAGEASKELTTVDEDMSDLVPMDQAPDYLQEEKTQGLEALGSSDFKIPRIKLLQSNNPEVQKLPGKAIPSEFWHTTANVSLGTEFRFVPCIASKRVILWAPLNSDHDGMLAFSRDGINWDQGANKRFEIKVQKIPNKLIWETGKNVHDSGLLKWGTYNHQDDESGPAAQLSYEYLMYLPDYPELSPVVMSCYRTGLTSGKQLNTSLLGTRKPIQSIAVRCFSSQNGDGQQSWFTPNFELKGFVNKAVYDIAKGIYDRQQNYQTTYDDQAPANVQDDSIPF